MAGKDTLFLAMLKRPRIPLPLYLLMRIVGELVGNLGQRRLIRLREHSSGVGMPKHCWTSTGSGL